jgi:hypothetical protein
VSILSRILVDAEKMWPSRVFRRTRRFEPGTEVRRVGLGRKWNLKARPSLIWDLCSLAHEHSLISSNHCNAKDALDVLLLKSRHASWSLVFDAKHTVLILESVRNPVSEDSTLGPLRARTDSDSVIIDPPLIEANSTVLGGCG